MVVAVPKARETEQKWKRGRRRKGGEGDGGKEENRKNGAGGAASATSAAVVAAETEAKAKDVVESATAAPFGGVIGNGNGTNTNVDNKDRGNGNSINGTIGDMKQHQVSKVNDGRGASAGISTDVIEVGTGTGTGSLSSSAAAVSMSVSLEMPMTANAGMPGVIRVGCGGNWTTKALSSRIIMDENKKAACI